MNVSIDWPKGRGHIDEPVDESFGSFGECDAQEGIDQHPVTAELDPYVLAPSRRDNWPELRDGMGGTTLLHIYSAVRQTGLPNMLGLRLPVPSQLNISAWQAAATGHHDDSYVLDGVRFGFPLHYAGPPLRRPNRDSHPSAEHYLDHIQRYVDVETANHAMLGPYDTSPFVGWTNISPLMTRPKSDSSKRRIIVDLSFPHGENVNHYVYKNMIFGRYHDHHLPTVADTVYQIEKMGYRAMLGTIDIERAYRNIPMCPLDLPLLGMRVGGKVYIDAAMPFGARNSSLNMQLIAQFIVRTLQQRGINCQMYLDDMVVQLSPLRTIIPGSGR